jgi:WD40 repeat protein
MSSPVIPDHVLLRPIGRGAYGEVWLARNIMGTLRAVKVIWRGQFESARPFEREFSGIQRFEPVSRSSGGLVHVLQVGKNDTEDYFYYVMELADDAAEAAKSEIPQFKEPRNLEIEAGARQQTSDFGNGISESYCPRTLRSDLKRLGRLTTAECLRLAIEVASGLGQLHRHGLVHRDVKPGNIIYVNGRAKLADMGLVAAEGEGRTFVGTEGYIPPEGPGSPTADLYALGVALYEASTGLPLERFPEVPPEWFSGTENDQALELHEVILQACEGQRERRYTNVDALQADLALLQSGESIRHTKALKRRYSRLRTAGLLGTTLLVMALAVALLASHRARLSAEIRAKETLLREQAQRAQAHAEDAEREARRQLQAALYEQARALVQSKEVGHRAKALEAISGAVTGTNTAELRRVAFAALGLPDLRLNRESALPPGTTFAEPDPDLKRIALGNLDAPVTVHSLSDLKVLANLPATTNNDAYLARWSHDGRFLAVSRQYDPTGEKSDLEVWDLSQNPRLVTVCDGVANSGFSFHPERPWLITGHPGGMLRFWNLEEGRPFRTFSLPGATEVLAYSPDGNRFATSYRLGSNWVVAIHDAATGALLSTTPWAEPATIISWHPGGQWIGVAGDTATEWNRGVRLLDLETGKIVLLGRHRIKTEGLSFSPDGDYLLSCSWERELIGWDLRTRQRAFTLAGSGYQMRWRNDGLACATVSKEDQVLLYGFERPACLELTGNLGDRLRPGTFSPDGRLLALSDNRGLCLWDVSGSSRASVVPETEASPLFFSPDGSQLFAVVGKPGQAHLEGWRVSIDSNSLAPPKLAAMALRTPPNLNSASLVGTDLLLASADGVRIVALTNLDSAGGRLVRIPPGSGTVSPDGRWLAMTYSFSREVTVYRLPQFEQAARLETSNFVSSVWFDPAGTELTIFNRSGVEQWDTSTWRLRRRQSGPPVSDAYVIYSPDGNNLWQVTNFRDPQLFDRATLQAILPLPSASLPLALSRDNRFLAVSVDDQLVQIWDFLQLHSHLRKLGLDW